MTIPLSSLQAMFALEADEFPIILVTLERTGYETLYLSSDPTARVLEEDDQIWYGTVSNGTTFLHYPFQLTLPGDQDEVVPGMTITVDNVSAEIGLWLRGSTVIPNVTVEIVTSGDLDTPIASFPDFEMKGFNGDSFQVQGKLTLSNLENEPFPAGTFNPTEFPGLF